MSNMKRRIEKLEEKTESIKKDAAEREAKFQELERLKEDDPVKALMLQAELEYGRKVTFAELIADAYKQRRSRGEK